MTHKDTIEADIREQAEALAEVFGWTVEETIAWLQDQLFGDHEPIRLTG